MEKRVLAARISRTLPSKTGAVETRKGLVCLCLEEKSREIDEERHAQLLGEKEGGLSGGRKGH